MTKDEALKLALEALEEAWYHVGTFQPTEKAIDLYDEARTAIKEALAQPEQKPVGEVGQIDIDEDGVGYAWFTIATDGLELGDKLYTTPPQRKPLTDEEIRKANHHMVEGAYDYSFKQGVKWAEYKHGIKEEA